MRAARRVRLGSEIAEAGIRPAYDPAVLLAIDVGNSNVTVGSFRNGSLTAVRRAATPLAATPDELEVLLEDLLRLDDAAFADVSAISCASVVPSVTTALEAVAERRERPLLLAGAGTVPLPIRTERPGDVGADRLVNALAASRLYGTPAVVVDMGTATTFDCVAREGAFVGGAIAPGIQLGLEALASRTAKLPRVELRVPDHAIGRDTAASIQSGAVLGYQALVAGLLARIRRELADAGDVAAAEVHVVLTGGLASLPWASSFEGVEAIDPELTLKGLAILHAEVAGGQPLELPLP
jgi:type III pantothenate kinase